MLFGISLHIGEFLNLQFMWKTKIPINPLKILDLQALHRRLFIDTEGQV